MLLMMLAIMYVGCELALCFVPKIKKKVPLEASPADKRYNISVRRH
jgi:hypothetical protein